MRHYDLTDNSGPYAVAAVAEHADCLELHLEVLRYGPRAARALAQDLEELKQLGRRLGKGRIVGLHQPRTLEADALWFKFTRQFGFGNQRLYQCAELPLD
jgi:hypothetical protein